MRAPAARKFSTAAIPLRNLIRSRSGNVAVLFAFSMLPILGLIGAAIDYSRANKARSAMQAAVDSAALMVSKDLSSGVIATSDVSTTASKYFSALYNNKDASGITVSASYTDNGSSGSTVSVNGSGTISTNFMKLVGYPNMNFNVGSTATWGSSLLRVALVLDNTGSMNASNKIGSLQSAATNLVNQLSALAKKNGDVMMSIIPFSTDVNVGTSNKNANWLRWDRWDPNMWYNAYWQMTWCSDNGWTDTLAQCEDHGYTWNHSPGSQSKNLWNGCVTDRDQNYDVTSTAPVNGNKPTQFIADQEPFCPVELLPLGYDWTQIKNKISSMVAAGATNQTIGLQWGWFSLLQQDPLNAPAEQAGNSYQKIIILFTDGLNTANRWYGNYSAQSPQVDARMKLLCDNIKATGVTIYTVQIDTDGAGQSAVLPYCATDASKFFMLTSPSQISSAFSQIGIQIAKLRVSK